MRVDNFLEPRLTGARFEDHGIPLELLKDLAVLEEMIVEVAKWKFKQSAGRKRSPRGFTEGVQLELTGVEEGSVRPVIALILASSALLPPQQVYLEQARDAIVSAIAAADHNTPITTHLPDHALGYFDRMGRSLREGEAFEFTLPGVAAPARLTRETRRKLILASTTVKELTEETSVHGVIPEADQDNMTFEVQLVDGHKVSVPMSPQHLETILEAFNGYQRGTRVLLHGVGKFNRNQRLLSFESIEHISILDDLDVPARIDELRGLKDGWLDGKGMALNQGGLDWLAQAFGQHFPDDLPLPHLYPTAEGGIQTEWSIASNEITIEIDLATHQAQWHCLDMSNNTEEVRALSLDNTQDWEWLVARIQGMAGGGV